jgi:hypothetical protein
MTYLALAIVCAYLIGFFKGACDMLQFHYGSGWTRFLRDKQFWNPAQSWKNKYKDYDNGDKRPKFLGSITFLVTFTDAWHAIQFYQSVCICALPTFAFLAAHHYPTLPWWMLLVAFITVKVLIQAGFKTTYK